MWRPRPSPRQNGTCAETETMNARPRGRNFSVAPRRQEQSTDGGSPRHPNVRRAPKSAWSPAPTLREELRAMVAPEKSNRSCAVLVHQRRKVCATQAAALAASFTRSRNNAEERDHDHHRKDHLEVEGRVRDVMQKPRARVDASSSETLRRLRDAPQEALFRAVEKGDIRGFRRTLRSSNVWIDARGPQDETPLLVAARLGHLECVRQCLARGAFVDARNASGESALHLASYAGHAEVVELLLCAAATVQPSTEFGETALFYAARKGYVHIARALILHGDDPYHADRFGDTALAQSRDAATRSAMEAAHRGSRSSTGERICTLQRAPLAVLARIMSFLDEDDFRAAGAASAAWAVAARHASTRPRPMVILRRSASRPQSSPMLSSSALVASERRDTRQTRGPSISSARQARERSRIFLPDNLDVLF